MKYEHLKTNHKGGIMPIRFAALGALGALAGGTVAIANAIKTSQHQSAYEAEMKKHNLGMEKIAQTKQLVQVYVGVVKKLNLKAISILKNC